MATSFIYTQFLMRFTTGLARGVWLVVAVAAIACASPPNKEMDQAKGAIDAARAAGAERYAPAEYATATEALKQANDAVTARDYRLALNYALESLEQAQNAARTAADTRAKVRGDVERSAAEIDALLAATRARVEAPAPPSARAARRTAQQRLKQLEGDLQKADAAVAAGEYMEAQRLLTRAREGLQAIDETMSKAAAAQSSRRRR